MKTVAVSKKKRSPNARELLEKTIDFCGVKLNAQQYKLLEAYMTPGSSTFHNAFQSAIKAGYKRNTAMTHSYNLLKRPDIQKIIKANEHLVHNALYSSAMRALEVKQRRAFYDVRDYFDVKEITVTDKNGEQYARRVVDIKDINEISEEERMCIDGIDIKGNFSIPVYIMPNREKELNDIIKLSSEFSKSAGGTEDEETREIIMERITVRETKRTVRPVEMDYEFVERESGSV